MLKKPTHIKHIIALLMKDNERVIGHLNCMPADTKQHVGGALEVYMNTNNEIINELKGGQNNVDTNRNQ